MKVTTRVLTLVPILFLPLAAMADIAPSIEFAPSTALRFTGTAVWIQSFTAEQTQVGSLALGLSKRGSPTTPLEVQLLDPEGAVIASGSIDPDVVLSTDFRNPTWTEVSMPAATTPGLVYLVRVTLQPGPASASFVQWSARTTNPYAGGGVYPEGTPNPAASNVDALLRVSGDPGQGAPPTPTVNLTATPDTIDLGDSATLEWVSTHATACEAADGPWTGMLAPFGAASVSPSETSLYTILCQGPGGLSSPSSATVTVLAEPPPPPPPPAGSGPPTNGPLQWIRTVAVPSTAVRDLVVRGNYLYASTLSGLAIYDVSGAATPVLVGAVDLRPLSPDCNGVAVEGDHAYLACGTVFAIVDVAVPSSPQIETRCLATSTCGGLFALSTGYKVGQLFDIAVKNAVAYVSTGLGTVHVIDAANPSAPTKVRAMGITAVPTGSTMSTTLFTRLQALEEYRGNGLLASITVQNDVLCTAEWKYGHIFCWNVTDPMNPTFRGGHGNHFSQDVRLHDVGAGLRLYWLQTYGGVSGLATSPLPPGTGTVAQRDPYMVQAPSGTILARSSCLPHCAFARTMHVSLDQGGVDVTGAHAIFAGGKGPGIVEVHTIQNPTALGAGSWRASGQLTTGSSYNVPMAHKVGVATRGEYIYVGAGVVGIQMYRFPGLGVPQ